MARRITPHLTESNVASDGAGNTSARRENGQVVPCIFTQAVEYALAECACQIGDHDFRIAFSPAVCYSDGTDPEDARPPFEWHCL